MLSIIDSNDIAQYAKRFTFKANDGTTHSLLEIIYPVGVYYWSSDNTTPKDLFGFGEWLQIKDKFVLAMGDKFRTINETGGSFKIEADKLPTHIHNMKISSGGMDKHSSGKFISINNTSYGYHREGVFTLTQTGIKSKYEPGTRLNPDAWLGRRKDTWGELVQVCMNIEHSHTFDVDLKDDNKNFPNKDYIQPYITAYCWKRIA